MSWLHIDEYLQSSDTLTTQLAECLYRGELALLVGSGVSQEFGTPGWVGLLRSCYSSLGLNPTEIPDDSDFDSLKSFATRVKEKAGVDYLSIVTRNLYLNASRESPSRLLQALGTLMMGSRRGRIREVWTLNYDDTLEWYLRIHGFVSQTVSNVPTLLRDVDVSIFHPHGYLPLDPRHGGASPNIVFDKQSYASRSLGKDEPWRDAFHWAIRSKIFIVIGLSWSDRLIQDFVTEASVKDVVNRPAAIWFFKKPVDKSILEACKDANVVPVLFDEHDEYVPCLLRIAEEAMEHVMF